VKPGDLVRITRSSILLPAGSVGLILRKFDQTHIQGGYTLLEVYFGKRKETFSSARRVLDRDLEVIS
jgi:hypothetical protein